MKSIYNLEEVSKLIEEGKILSIAADEKLLAKLPKGKYRNISGNQGLAIGLILLQTTISLIYSMRVILSLRLQIFCMS